MQASCLPKRGNHEGCPYNGGLFRPARRPCYCVESTQDGRLATLILGRWLYSVILNWSFFSLSKSTLALRYWGFKPAFFRTL